MIATRARAGMFVATIAILLLAACGGSEEATFTPDLAAPEATKAPAATEAPEVTQPSATVEEQPVPTEAPAQPTQEPEDDAVIPSDVPIAEGAMDLVVEPEVGSVTYHLEDTLIEDVVEFYQTTMAEQGWEAITTSAIGLMATLVFETDQSRVSVSLQANNIAKTVNVRLFIIQKE